MEIRQPYLMFLGDAPDQLAAKTAKGVAYWRPDACIGQLRLEGCKADLGLPDMSVEEAAEKGVKTLVIGVANRGGRIAPTWEQTMLKALDLGMDIASGLHKKVADIPSVREKAAKLGRSLFDVRHPTNDFELGTGAPRTGRRVLTVGTDCSVGKMFASLALEDELKKRGANADFRATGQTGIFIAGSGVSVDAVISDFISGAVEAIAPENDPNHWDLIEGQGSLFHASFAGVSMGLIHGAQADYLVMCHEPGRPHMRGLPHYGLPDIAEAIALNERCARLTNPRAKVVGIACNTSAMSESEAESTLAALAKEFGMPAVDPVRTGVASIVDAMLADAGETA
ncbi:N-acetyltransferase DgcN [Fodinicurvata sp. EGI_FJ10296]|uniref:N-acetyltransferase DgcN n=1 Tax=Fodinicurvata sp. EGI_FJ10296 TaxID=3231908 RepID=UPI003453EDCD